ncbi:WGxxGxxG-CTERM domain-containing protein [Rhodococcus sp. HM1]|uniref:WGxxGxxG family protein n=1 Tax=unclassified Rhodococcus (in: high G+C Gram-positive bacteria) TaxID=192944 RepID=UPI0018CDCF01|nr:MULTISPECIES: WGxxGxxG family protein [unclassified Rhodococcus (in: high G+C Gram-positive bacteria)]MBH0123205.1 WGxxGxxG-CTERM domain-containing protein [Rhodococcus sp. CX]MCK8671740.1 WGxxGxxG-CTERM domain-containing protein [Rhodococcus sp. HM1]
MRKTIIAVLAATTVAFTGAGLAHADTSAPATAAVVAQAENDPDDGDNTGLWGLLGLAGLVGLAGLKRRNAPATPVADGTVYGTDPNRRL